jgi:uncharacterized protein involved in outer membrane biogenesis
MPATSAPSRRRWLRRGAIAASVVAGYAVLGFLVAPPILRRTLVERASAALHREVSVARVRLNPFALSVTVEGLTVVHPGGVPFVAWDSLYVRLAPLRLVRGELGVAEIRLVRPAVHVALDAGGRLAFQDLLEPGAPSPVAPPPAAGGAAGGVAVFLGRLAVEEARVVFVDQTRRPAFATTLGPVSIRLESFHTRGGGDSPYSFAATTDSGETLRWTGTVSTEPLRSAGRLAFERIKLPRYTPYLGDDVLRADLKDGVLDLETRYEVEWGKDRHVLRLSDGKLLVERLALSPRGVQDPPVELARLQVNGVEADAVARTARVAEVTVRGAKLRVRREADGALELPRMAPAPAPAARDGDGDGDGGRARATGKESPPPAPWSWAVGQIAVAGATVRVEDLSTPRPVSFTLADLGVSLAPLSGKPDAVSKLAVSATYADRGRLAVAGAVRPLAGDGALEVDASDLDLVPVAPYLEPDVVARLAAARAGVKARISFDASAKAPRWTFAGDLRLDGLSVAEQGNEDLLRWRALEVAGVDAASTPPRVSVRLVRLVEPRAKVYVWDDGATSLARAIRAKPAARAGGHGAKPAGPAAPAWRIAIGTVRLERGRLTFVDRSVAPPPVVNVTRADARITRLSTDPGVRSTVDVALQVEGSPVTIKGALDALRNDAFTDLTIVSKGVDLTPLDPYGGKFLGYGIQKGKLDLDLRYKVEERILTGANVVTVNQFTLGDRTDSPDATKIPVRLALALLQDKDGVILLDVPVEGKLDDPEFKLGKVIWHTVLNVLVKVATSPFRALAALAGGGDADLSMADFEPGTATPAATAADRFQLLARSLAQRPALGLELEGAADPERDGAVLRRAALERTLRRTKAATLRPVPASLDEVSLAPEERVRLVHAVYRAAFPAPVDGKGAGAAAPLTAEQMEERLAGREEVPPEALRTLAAERAQRAREALVEAGLEPGRIFLAADGTAGKEKAPRVYFSVR